MNIPEGLLYTKSHEWVKVEGDVAVMGISEYAAHHLGDIVFVEMPEMGDTLTKEESFGVVESVKTVSDIYSPVSGEVVARNAALLQEIDGEDNEEFHPEYVNEEPYGKGWLLKIKLSDSTELNDLLKAGAYKDIAKD